MRTIWWDMDGTIANLYAVENWLLMLLRHMKTPVNMCADILMHSMLQR